MAFEWPVDPQDLFLERYPQMVNTGLAFDLPGTGETAAPMSPDRGYDVCTP
ncbi:hypothetical protein [Nocardia sp. NPDC020380]|uniref:hypothetical protein n=1 Tax=Nocardia sp. NPDC020380 TaxID=3364309 RepID=UPI003789406C